MRLVTFTNPNARDTGVPRMGARVADRVLDFHRAAHIAGITDLACSLKALLGAGPGEISRARNLLAEAQTAGARFDSAWLDE